MEKKRERETVVNVYVLVINFMLGRVSKAVQVSLDFSVNLSKGVCGVVIRLKIYIIFNLFASVIYFMLGRFSTTVQMSLDYSSCSLDCK